MNNSIKMVMVALLMVVFACSSGDNKQSANMDFSTFKVSKPVFSHFSEFGKITKAIKLETSGKSLVGRIDKVIVDKNNGDILIGDYDSNKKVLRFNGLGKYIMSYGSIGAGPSEHQQLMGFCTNDNGDVILLGDSKLIVYAKSGEFLREARLNCSPIDIESISDKFYVSVMAYRKSVKEKKAIQIYNSFLVNIGGIGQFESNLEKYKFISKNAMTKRGNTLYFADKYDFILNIYDASNQKLSQLKIQNNNKLLDSVWGKTHLTEKDRTEIRQRLQIFRYIFPFNDGIFLTDVCPEKKSYDLWRLNLDKNEALIVSLFCFFENSELKDQAQLFFSGISGAYDNGIIGFFSDPEEFNPYKASYSVLKGITLQMEDNPILAFFQFN